MPPRWGAPSPAQRQRRVGGKRVIGEVLGQQPRPGGGGNHGGVIRRERQRGKSYAEVAARGLDREAGAEFAIGGYAPGDQNAPCVESFGGGKGLLHQVANYRVLKAGDQVERLRVAGCQSGFDSWVRGGVMAGKKRIPAGFGFGTKVMQFNVAQHGRLDSRK